jgi:hypothetical protein
MEIAKAMSTLARIAVVMGVLPSALLVLNVWFLACAKELFGYKKAELEDSNKRGETGTGILGTS